MLSEWRGEECGEWGEQVGDREEAAREFEGGQYAKMASDDRENEELDGNSTNTINGVHDADTFSLVESSG